MAKPYQSAMIVPMIPIASQLLETIDDDINEGIISVASLPPKQGRALQFGVIIVLSKEKYREFQAEELSSCHNFGVTIPVPKYHPITRLLTSLVNNVLDLAKLEKGRHNRIQGTKTVDLISMMREAIEIAKVERGKPSVSSIVTVEGLNWLDEQADALGITQTEISRTGRSASSTIKARYTIKADPESLQRVLLNLLNNAFKFTNEGYVHLDLSRLNMPAHTEDIAS
ncbi:hypothetical protein BZG36_00585 [Bifiguratus adelaidae]|uniref:Histidine kinase domain-containing protein n=1 Tax=Bifiguratus adelaidae TaxID=1938954 RepID=A0A261Y7F8_9FUNG|nr:hypothetical protein BZG36_00585 [Bifiguratus adelaidae]